MLLNDRETMGDPDEQFIIGQDDLVLVTGATGFIGSRLVAL